MSVLSKVYTFIHYATMPIRFILFMLILYIFIQIIAYSDDEIAIQSYLLVGSKILTGLLLSLNINIPYADIVKYLEYVYSDKKFIVIFNHTTFIDSYILFGTFPRLAFLMLKIPLYDIIGYNERIHKKTCGIFISKGETTQMIMDHVNSRKSGGYVLFAAPGSGNTPVVPGNITEFKSSGAFAGKFPVLPVLVKYEDDTLNHNYDNGESMLHSCLKLFLVNNYRIDIKVGDMIEPDVDESVDEYKDRVYNVMNTTYHQMGQDVKKI